MWEDDMDIIPVVDAEPRVSGIFSDRDIARVTALAVRAVPMNGVVT